MPQAHGIEERSTATTEESSARCWQEEGGAGDCRSSSVRDKFRAQGPTSGGEQTWPTATRCVSKSRLLPNSGIMVTLVYSLIHSASVPTARSSHGCTVAVAKYILTCVCAYASRPQKSTTASSLLYRYVRTPPPTAIGPANGTRKYAKLNQSSHARRQHGSVRQSHGTPLCVVAIYSQLRHVYVVTRGY